METPLVQPRQHVAQLAQDRATALTPPISARNPLRAHHLASNRDEIRKQYGPDVITAGNFRFSDGRPALSAPQSPISSRTHTFIPRNGSMQKPLVSPGQVFDFELASIPERAAVTNSRLVMMDENDLDSPTVRDPLLLIKFPDQSNKVQMFSRRAHSRSTPLALMIDTSALKRDTQTTATLSADITSGYNRLTPALTMATTPDDNPTFLYSPSSMYTQDEREESPFTPRQLELKDSKDITDVNTNAVVFDDRIPLAIKAEQQKSLPSESRMVGLGIQESSSTHALVPLNHTATKSAPPRSYSLQMNQARPRASVTSLPDLIRRATRLASNLDRGKTASHLGLEDFFRGEKETSTTRRKPSTGTSTLLSLPLASEAKTVSNISHGQISSWSHSDKTSVQPTPSILTGLRRKPRRQCCSLSLPLFICAVLSIIILIAAAVMIPVFLIVMPRQFSSANSLSQCSSINACRNGGVGVVDDNRCVCVCADGFTGSQCTTTSDPSCIMATVADGSRVYKNATMGSDIAPLLSGVSKFGISLNSSIVLSVFATNDLSCAGENSLVHFNSSATKRQYAEDHLTVARKLPIAQSADARGIKRWTVPMTKSTLAPSARRRSDQRDIVKSPSQWMPKVAKLNSTTADTIDFAQRLILYVLSQSRSPSAAVNAQLVINQYLTAGGVATGNNTVPLSIGSNKIVNADFASLHMYTA